LRDEDPDNPDEPTEDDPDEPEEPLEEWVCPEYEAAATPEKTPVAASPPTRV
jgi:hypothetical protein